MNYVDNELEEWLNHNDLGLSIVRKKYLATIGSDEEGNPVQETFSQWMDRISNGNADIRKLLVEKKFLFGGRILSNRKIIDNGIKSTLSNCYVLSVDDNIESIYKCCSDMARTYSYGGGVGIDISKLRPRGAVVHNSAKTTSGAVSFMKTFDVVTGTIGQSGRRGALMISLDIRHPDIEEFIDIKANTTEITNANISVRVNDEFMSAVENDKDYILRYPCETTLSETITESLSYGEVKYENGVYLKKVKAKELFMKIAKNNWDYGEPGVLYWDRICNYNLMSENPNFKYAGVNPCVSGDTLILTDKGYKRIDSLVGNKVNVWNGYEWSEVEPRITGHNQEMVLITLSNGIKLNCTKYHKFVLKDGSRVEARDLKIKDKLIKCNFPVINSGETHEEKLYYTLGFFAGDGYFKREDEPVIYLYDKKKCVLPYILDGVVREDEKDNRLAITLTKYREYFKDKDYVPNCEVSLKDRLEWLSGLIDSDGNCNDASGSITISSVNRQFLQDVQLLLNTLGVASSVNVMHKSGEHKLPKHNENNEYGIYHCNESYRLCIGASQVQMLLQLGLSLNRVKVNPNVNRNASRFIEIVNIEDNSTCDTVYCFNEPKNHTGIFNGCITAQCAEEPLPDGGACLLGSMNLKCYVKDNGEFDYDEFGKDVRIATTALNEVQQEGIELHPLPIQKQTATQFRQIGLGIFDLAGALIKMKVRYGSEESCKVAYDITHTMLLEAFKQSCDLNTDGVVYEGMFDSEMYKKQIKPYLPPEYINRYPLNSQILTIAPTGTLSTMVNATSGGGEPMFATYYTRTTKSLYGKDVTFKVYPQCILDFYNGEPETLDDLPDYFITADKLDWRERVKMQGTLQKNIDASISSTVNLKESSTIEDVFNIYLTAWKEGLKGITIFRDNCKRVAILSKPVQEIEPLTEFKTTTAPKRPKALEADFYQIKAMGEDFRVFVGLYEGRPYEIFAMPCESCDKLPSHKGQIIKTKKRTYRFVSDLVDIENIALNEEGDRIYRNVTLHVSGALRHGMPIKSIISLEEKCNDNIISFNKAISRVLAKYLPKDTITDDTCPECGNKLVFENGCKHCPSCGYSQCG